MHLLFFLFVSPYSCCYMHLLFFLFVSPYSCCYMHLLFFLFVSPYSCCYMHLLFFLFVSPYSCCYMHLLFFLFVSPYSCCYMHLLFFFQFTVESATLIMASSRTPPPQPTPTGSLRGKVTLAVESHSPGGRGSASSTSRRVNTSPWFHTMEALWYVYQSL